MFVLYFLCCVGSDLCEEFMTRLEESYRVFVCLYLYTNIHTTDTLDMLDKGKFFLCLGFVWFFLAGV
jgi:hypothetical protein